MAIMPATMSTNSADEDQDPGRGNQEVTGWSAVFSTSFDRAMRSWRIGPLFVRIVRWSFTGGERVSLACGARPAAA
jgi:hypothetical protein